MATAGKYWGTEPLGATPIRTDGFIDTQLAVSRDTVSWQRFREPFLPRGEAGAWDWGMLYADAPIRHGDRLMIYYLGANLTHGGRSPVGGEIPFSRAAQRGKGLATLRPDGYVGVEASGYAPGQLTTHRFRQELVGPVRTAIVNHHNPACFRPCSQVIQKHRQRSAKPSGLVIGWNDDCKRQRDGTSFVLLGAYQRRQGRFVYQRLYRNAGDRFGRF